MNTLDKPKFKQISVNKIETSPEIAQWLTQFSDSQQAIAKNMLSKLKFVTRDEFTRWLQRAILDLPKETIYALFSVRKLAQENQENTDSQESQEKKLLWDLKGEVVNRPGHSQGSEDLVYSVVSNLVRSNKESLLDHPSLTELKKRKIRSYVLIDDSIGSGDRVSEFINSMLANPTFLSWWSLGLIRIILVSFTRTKGSEARIINRVRGSDHGRRKFRKSDKIRFISEFVYNEEWLETRWGNKYNEIITLCHSKKKICAWARLGYGGILSNIIFYHSVPNNIPGVFWFSNKKWQGLMSGRAIPNWLLNLLENTSKQENDASLCLSSEVIKLLELIKRGVRDVNSISLRLNTDCSYTEKLIQYVEMLGLLTSNKRLTKLGLSKILGSKRIRIDNVWDYSLYIPKFWSADQRSIQPSINDE